MSPEDRKLLEKTYDLARENHEMLTSLRRSQLFGRFVKIAYWIAIIALSSFALQAIQPYLQELQGIAGTAKNITGGATTNYSSLIQELTK